VSVSLLRRLLSPSLFLPIDCAPPYIYALSLHDALPICFPAAATPVHNADWQTEWQAMSPDDQHLVNQAFANIGKVIAAYERRLLDRKSTRLNSSHVKISYAVFCLKKKIELLTPPHAPKP